MCPPEYATINCAQNCVFYGIEVRANGSYNPITVAYGATVTLAAGSPQGTANEGCQLLICDWYDNGAFIGFGKTRTHTFQAAGAHDVVANCECSPCDLTASDDVVVNVASCASGVQLKSLTEAVIPSPRTRTKLGVAEKVTLTLDPAPACSVAWSMTGTVGSISSNSGNQIVFTAPNVAGSTTVKANIGGTTKQVTFTTVEPTAETSLKISSLSVSQTYGACMKIQTILQPTDVSFHNTEIREISSPATNKQGFFADKNVGAHNVPLDAWAEVSAGNSGEDIAGFGFELAQGQTLGTGSFTYNIPMRWRVVDTSAEKSLPNVIQLQEVITQTGTSRISKLGSSDTRLPDPNSPNTCIGF